MFEPRWDIPGEKRAVNNIENAQANFLFHRLIVGTISWHPVADVMAKMIFSSWSREMGRKIPNAGGLLW